jgi:hypothetical protein
MMMRFRGGGIGHKTTHHASETFKEDANTTHETIIDGGKIERQLEDEDLSGLQLELEVDSSDNDSDGLEDEGYNESCESDEVTESESDVQSDSD